MDLDNSVADYFKSHTLSQCAQQYKCSKATIKRKLRALNVDTSMHNHSQLAIEAFKKTCKDVSFLTDGMLYHEYILLNKDTKTIAEEHDLHFNTIRNRLRTMRLKKDLRQVSLSMQLRHLNITGYRHPSQRPDVLAKILKCSSRFEYLARSGRKYFFNSLYELCYAIMLDQNDTVSNWDYKLIQVPYVDRLTGKWHIYYIDFSVQSCTGDKWVVIKSQKDMVPTDKYLYAAQAAKKANAIFTGITAEERSKSYNMFIGGLAHGNVEFINPAVLRDNVCYTLWFKDTKELDRVQHDHYTYIFKCGRYVKCKFIAKTTNKDSPISTIQSNNGS